MKKIAALVVLGFAAMSAQAQVYNLDSVIITVPFGSAPVDSFTAGTATVTGTSVAITNANWALTSNPNAQYSYAGDWTTSVGTGVNVIKVSETCVEAIGDGCTNAYNGKLGDFINGFDQNGLASTFAVNSVTQTATTLVVSIGQRFIGDPTSFFFDTPQSVNLSYVVPVPAAVWLFGSALGLMAWLRRRVQA